MGINYFVSIDTAFWFSFLPLLKFCYTWLTSLQCFTYLSSFCSTALTCAFFFFFAVNFTFVLLQQLSLAKRTGDSFQEL